MAREPMTPADSADTTDREEINPSTTLPNYYVPTQPGDLGDRGDIESPVEWDYFLRDGMTPYRRPADDAAANTEVFSQTDNGWMTQNMVDPASLWPSDANEVAGMIGGEQRLTEPVHGVMPPSADEEDSYAPEDEESLAEADAAPDAPPPDPSAAPAPDTSDDTKRPPAKLDRATAAAAVQNEAYQGAGASTSDIMHERHVRDAGMAIDLPFETPSPSPLQYADAGQQTWTPPPGFRMGMPPIDPQLAEELGVPRDLSTLDDSTATMPVGPTTPVPEDEGDVLQEAAGEVVMFDPLKHPREWHGHFAEVLAKLPKPGLRGRGGGEAHIVGGSHQVRRTKHGFEVTRHGETGQTFRTAEEAAKHVGLRHDSEVSRRAAEAERQDAHAHNKIVREDRAAKVDHEAAKQAWYRFETPENAKRIQESGELWGRPSLQGRGVPAARAQPHRPDDSTIAHERANGRVLVEFHTQVRPDNDVGKPHFSWTPGSSAQRIRELDRRARDGQHPHLRLEEEGRTATGRTPTAKLKVHGVKIIS